MIYLRLLPFGFFSTQIASSLSRYARITPSLTNNLTIEKILKI